MKISRLVIALLSVALISACENEPTENLQDSIVESTPESAGSDNPSALFDPTNSVIPFPNNLLFAGSQDGTLNIPVADASDLSDPQVALNALDGFSTVAPMSVGLSAAVDESSISASSVRLYEVTLSGTGGAVVAVNDQLTFGVDYVAVLSSVDSTDSTIAILPRAPLSPSTSYMVVLTDELMSAGGKPFGPSITYRLFKSLAEPLDCSFPIAADYSNCMIPGAFLSELATLTDETEFNAQLASLEGLRQIITVSEATVAGSDASLNSSDIILGWSFTTQSVGDVLGTVQAMVGTPDTSLTASTVDLGYGAGAGFSPMGAAAVYEGTIDVPYYLTAPSVSDPTASLTKPWQAANAVAGEHNLSGLNPLPAVTDSALSIPLLVTVPTNAAFTKPWRTVIFQHGITSDRTAMLAAADALASVGFAVVAIDMPLHGVNSSSPFYQAGNERTFDVDFVTQDGSGNITAATPDGTVDSSGAHFINLTNLLVTRDNLRQSVADLFALTAAIPDIDVDGGGADLDGSSIYFVGHSLGAIVGTTFTALQTDVLDSVFAFGGASMAKIIDGSAAFSPTIVAGLAAQGVNKGTADYESFLGAAQTVIDSADPVNYGASAAAGRGVLYFEIVGGNSSPSDLVVPNTVPDGNDSSGLTVPAPLAGTEPMLTLMGLTQVNSSQSTPGSDLKVSVKFTAGDHSSILSPAADAGVTTEMQTEMASFLDHDGEALAISDNSAIQAP
jgi:pimeloyl-ACP methyl ester carboxylesterase